MIHIRFTYLTGIIEVWKETFVNGLTTTFSFEMSADLLHGRRELFDYYVRFRRHGLAHFHDTCETMEIALTDQTTVEFHQLRCLVQESGSVRFIMEGSVLA